VIDDSVALVNKHRSTGILVDSNLLLVLFVGLEKREWVGQRKRVKEYSPWQFDLLDAMVSDARLLTTPNIATEVSNLSGLLDSEVSQAVKRNLAAFLQTYDEEYIDSKFTSEHDAFAKLGITDTVLLHLAESGKLVLTADWPLARRLESNDYPVVNFNHMYELG